MKYEAGNRFNPDTYFKTEVDSTSVTVKVTGELEGVEVSFDSGDVPEITSLSVTENGTYEAPEGTAYDPVTVEVPNSYTAADEGKVVSSGALVSQTSVNITQNGTVNTTLNNEAVVNVPNSYSAADEGKVVDQGALVTQTSRTVTANDTYDTTLNNEIVVNVSGGSDSDLKGLIERSLTSISIPAGTTKIGVSAFENCTALTSVTMPNSVTEISTDGFYGCTALSNIVLSTGLITLGASAFSNCRGLTSVVIPDSVTNIGQSAFEGCSNLASVTLPENSTLNQLPLKCFRNTALTAVDIPANIISLYDYSLMSSALQNITLRANSVVTATSNALYSVPASCNIFVPADLVETYKSDTYWSARSAYIQAIPTP